MIGERKEDCQIREEEAQSRMGIKVPKVIWKRCQ